MKVSNWYLVIPALLAPAISSAVENLPKTGTLPDIVYVRRDCGTQVNCATTMKEATDWIAVTRLPTESRPVSVDIGPGTFGGPGTLGGLQQLTCTSYTSWVGAGPEQTNIKPGINGKNCKQFHVSSLRVTRAGAAYAAVLWEGGGDSTWTNVQLVSDGYGWVDSTYGGCSDRAKHQWFSSRISAAFEGYAASCSENWFWGSEVSVTAGEGVESPKAVIAVTEPGGVSPEFHFYGSNIKLVLPEGQATAVPAAGGQCAGAVAVCSSGEGASVHIHGTGIDIVGNALSNHVVALAADDGGHIHANGSAFNLSTAAGGTIQRVWSGTTGTGGHIHAPYLWETHPSAPFEGSGVTFKSKTGFDTAIVTDTGRPRMVIYDSTCTSGWFDTVTQACR